jgi:hypothetical protein
MVSKVFGQKTVERIPSVRKIENTHRIISFRTKLYKYDFSRTHLTQFIRWIDRYKLGDRDFKAFILVIAAVFFSLFISSLCSIGLIGGSISIHGGFLENLNKVLNHIFCFC